MSKICLVVLNYNDSETTIGFVNRIKNYDALDNIVVVDNFSTDDSFIRMKRYESPKISVVRTDKNGGYSYGNNFGIKFAIKEFLPEYVIVSNPDVRFEERIIAPMLSAFEEDSDIALVSPRMQYPNGKKAIVAWKLPKWKDNVIFLFNSLNSLYRKFTVYSEKELNGERSFVDVLPGSFFIADVEKLKRVDFFDEDTFLYCEEIILSYKLKQAGYRCVLLNRLAYIHDHSISINKSYNSSIKKYRLLINSIGIYNRKYLRISKLEEQIYHILCRLCIIEKKVILWAKSFL